MKRVAYAVLSFFCWCGMMIVAAVVYVALTLFPPKSRW